MVKIYFKRTVKYLLLFFIAFYSCNGDKIGIVLDYPELKPSPKTEQFFRTKVLDNYHGLSNLQDTSTQNWFKSQDSLAENYFSNDRFLGEFKDRFHTLENKSLGYIGIISITEKGSYLYSRYDYQNDIENLYYREKLSDFETEVFNASAYNNKNTNISYLKPSHDGTKVAIGFDSMEDFSSTVIIYDLVNKRILKEKITQINPDFGGIEWLPDSSGFIYLYFPEVELSKKNYKKESYSVIHFLGEDIGKRTPIFGKEKSLKIPSDYYPKVKIGSSKDSYIIGYAAKSGDYYDSFIASTKDVINGAPKWKPFFKTGDGIYYNQGEIRGQYFIYRRATSNGNEICQVIIENPNFDDPLILARGSQENPITKFEVTKDHIYFIREKFGVEVSLFKIDGQGNEVQIVTPFIPGYASFFGESVVHNNIGIGMDGWTSNYVRYRIGREGKFTDEGLVESTLFPEFKDLVTKQVMVVSHDGVEVPFSLVYRKDMKQDNNNEVFVYVYGANGESMSPFFSPIYLDWARQGGILAFPHVRGGGEKGKEWHIQGMKNLKSNSWKDLIACTEFLFDNGYSRKGLVSLYTSSAGGITAGMAVNDSPDLFSSFIAEVPRMHPFGLESATTTSSTSYLEYGTVKDSLEFLGLIKMDPYLNLKPETNYPATLIMPSSNDDRIPLWDSGKYIAQLQKYNSSKTPVLMDIDYTSGHENTGGQDAYIEIYARIFSFAKTHMKH